MWHRPETLLKTTSVWLPAPVTEPDLVAEPFGWRIVCRKKKKYPLIVSVVTTGPSARPGVAPRFPGLPTDDAEPP